jgi:glycosyltransferase involved in cell wall biosynthesis
MKISIITPCLNAETSIARAIESVKGQNYKNWEHIIIDGGSRDGTLAILAKYPHLKIKCGPDAGQADAMNKGIDMASGDIIGFLNADDYYFPEAFLKVIEAFDDQTDFVVGNVLVKSKRLNAEFLNTPRFELEGMLRHWEPNAFSHNPVGYFYRLSVQELCPFNTQNYESMDLEFLLAAASVCKFKKIEFTLGCFEDGHDTKTDKTQLKPDYWRPSTFPYVEQYLDRLSESERAKYENDRREGYALEQANANWRARERGKMPALPSKGRPKVSIIIPTYNDSDVLPQAINSALAQSYENIEIIIVDDASDQDVSEFTSRKYQGEERIKVLRHPQNKMLGGARNSGIDFASGDYIFFLDSDDSIFPDSIERLLSIALACNVDVVQGASLIVEPDGESKVYHAAEFASDGGVDGLELFAAHKYASLAWNKLYKTAWLRSSRIRFAEKYMHEDVVFAAKTAFLAEGIVSISDPVIQYTINTKSLTQRPPTRTNIESYVATYADLIGNLENFGLGQEKFRPLILRILRAHGSDDFGRKLIACYKQMGSDAFAEGLSSVAWQHSGASGLAMADLITFFLGKIVPSSRQVQPNGSYFGRVRHSLAKALRKSTRQ